MVQATASQLIGLNDKMWASEYKNSGGSNVVFV